MTSSDRESYQTPITVVNTTTKIIKQKTGLKNNRMCWNVSVQNAFFLLSTAGLLYSRSMGTSTYTRAICRQGQETTITEYCFRVIDHLFNICTPN